jgi:hypothetical protein
MGGAILALNTLRAGKRESGAQEARRMDGFGWIWVAKTFDFRHQIHLPYIQYLYNQDSEVLVAQLVGIHLLGGSEPYALFSTLRLSSLSETSRMSAFPPSSVVSVVRAAGIHGNRLVHDQLFSYRAKNS